MSRIVILDGRFANPGDLNWDRISNLASTTLFDSTEPAQVIERSQNAEILIINKVKLDKAHFAQLSDLKLICISATGTDNVNLNDAEDFGISVKNAVGYSTSSVAQHVFSLILHFTNQVTAHSESVKRGEWNSSTGFSFTLSSIPELKGKNIGIYGFGKIGAEVAKIAEAFGMSVLVTSNHASKSEFPNYEFVDLETLFAASDFISLHAPLSETNNKIVDAHLLKKVKSTAILINTARGGLIDEVALFDALKSGQLAGAALDVLSVEPPESHPLFSLSNCIVTPHMAWTSADARRELIRQVGDHVEGYMKRKNTVN